MSRVVAKRYARALFELAQERKIIDDVEEHLSTIKETFDSSTELKDMLLHPKVATEDKKNLVKEILGEQLNQEVLNFLFLLIDRRREMLINEMTEEYITLANEARGIADATVTSAKALTDEEKTRLAEQFGNKLHKTLRLDNKVDADLIGGLVIQIGDRLFDGSVKGKLNRFQQNLKHSQVR